MAAPTISGATLTGDGNVQITWSDSTGTFSQVVVPIIGANGKLLALDSSGNVVVGSSAHPGGAVHHVASVITISGSAGTLAARATRVGGVLSAPRGNTADIVVESSGFHIAPGGALSISAVDAYAFTGTNSDTLNVYEEYN